jgi:hypothetical protein
MTRLSLQVTSCIVDSAAIYIIWWYGDLEILFGPLHRSSPFIGELRCQAIQMEPSPYIAERTQKAVYIVRCLWFGLGNGKAGPIFKLHNKGHCRGKVCSHQLHKS